MSAPNTMSRANSLKANNSSTQAAAATSEGGSNPLDCFAEGAGGYDPPTTSTTPTPTPGADVKTSQPQQSQGLPPPPPSSTAAVVAAAVTAAAPRPPPLQTSTSPPRSQKQEQKTQPQPSMVRKNSLLKPPQQPSYAKYATTAAMNSSNMAMAAANWAAGGRRRSSIGLMPSPPAMNMLAGAATTSAAMAAASLPMMSLPALDSMNGGARLYNAGVLNKELMVGANGAVGSLSKQPVSPSDASAVNACKERAARVGDDFARKRKLQMDAESKRNPKRARMEKRPEEMTKEELKKKSYSHRLYLNRQSAAVSRVRRQAYVKFLEESLTDIEQSKYQQENQIGSLRDENSKLKAQLQQMQNGFMSVSKGMSTSSSQGMGAAASYGFAMGSGQRNSRYSRRR